MQIQIVSDLHTEFHRDRGHGLIRTLDPRGVDVLVVAGDLSASHHLEQSIRWLCACYVGINVVYVVGNHEYYGSDPRTVHALLSRLDQEIPHFNWLHNSTVEIRDSVTDKSVRFAGTPLWFRETADTHLLKRGLNDFSQIGGFDPWVYKENEAALRFLEKEAAQADVVVSHHLPTAECVAPHYRGDRFNCYFLCEVGHLMAVGERKKPALWCCGHTHTSADVTVGGTRVVCNPLGYPHEANASFQEKWVVEVLGL